MALTFLGWRRSNIYGLRAAGSADHRTLTLVLSDPDDPAAPDPRNTVDLPFSLIGPDDIAGLQPAAVTRTYPVAGASGVEITKCVFAEFAAPDLPWRYSQETPVPGKDEGDKTESVLRPWIVLVVGTPEEVAPQGDGNVKLLQSLCGAYDLNNSARWAHIQEENGIVISRVLSSRALDANTNYNAAIVRVGVLKRWPLTGGYATVPLFHFWQFQTGETDDFRALAARLKPAVADDIGSVKVSYRPLSQSGGVAPKFSVRGALVSPKAVPPLSDDEKADLSAISADLSTLFTVKKDGKGRPIIGLPLYGDAWVDDPKVETTWGAEANNEAQHRAIAGLGMWAGIELQEMISNAARDQVGALDIAAQRIRNFTFGLQANTSLWKRRLPTDLYERLLLFGPSLSRIVTTSGPVLNQIAGGRHPLAPNIFSSAALRALRSPALKNLTDPAATLPANLLQSANTCPPPVASDTDGLPHANSAPRPEDPEDAGDFARKCIDFRGRPMSLGPNPILEQGVTFVVKDGHGNPARESRIGTWLPELERDENGQPKPPPAEMVALAYGKELEIILPGPASRVELRVMHVISPPIITAYNRDGTVAGILGMEDPQLEPRVLTINGRAITRVVITAVTSPDFMTYLLEFCFKGTVEHVAWLDHLIEKAIGTNHFDHQALLDRLDELMANPTSNYGPRDASALKRIREEFSSPNNLHVPVMSILMLIDSFLSDTLEDYQKKVDQYQKTPSIHEPDDESLLNLAKGLLTGPPDRPCEPIHFKPVVDGLTDSLDPTRPDSITRNRVLGGITGLGTASLLPPEVCVGLDLPVWSFLRERAPDWLLPGLESVEPNSVIAMESNSSFIDAFLLGLNTQVLNELRWRNIAIASKCTPIKMFWGRLKNAGSQREMDIQGVESWQPASTLGPNHRPGGLGADTLVLLICGELFFRYPATLLYLVSAADWTSVPSVDDREVPTFQGSIGADITFFCFDIPADSASSYWVVLEETPRGYSFGNDGYMFDTGTRMLYNEAKGGRNFALAAFANPLRVFIRGEDII